MSRVNKTETRCDHYEVTGLQTREDGSIITVRGKMVKEVEYSTTVCPECYDNENDRHIAAWRDHHGDEICPECGMVCGEKKEVVLPSRLAYGRTRFDSLEA